MNDSIIYTSPDTFTSTRLSSACDVSTSRPSMPTSHGVIDNKVVTVLRDTGCSGVVVRKDCTCINKDQITNGEQVCVTIPNWELKVNAVEARQQVREKRKCGYRKMLVPDVIKDSISPSDVQREQQNDPSLSKIKKLISEGKQNDN